MLNFSNRCLKIGQQLGSNRSKNIKNNYLSNRVSKLSNIPINSMKKYEIRGENIYILGEKQGTLILSHKQEDRGDN